MTTAQTFALRHNALAAFKNAAAGFIHGLKTPLVILSAAVLGLSAASASAAEGTPAQLTLSTATTGGAFHQGGVTLSALVKLKLMHEQRIDLTTVNSSGSVQNIARLRDGTADLAIVQSLLGHYAREGIGVADALGQQREMRSIMMLWPNVEHFIVRKDLAKTGTITDFLALMGKRVSLGAERSAIESNRVLLENLGLNIDRDLVQVPLGLRQSVLAFNRGEIDGLSLPASTPIPAFVDLMELIQDDAVILRWTDEQRLRADGGLGLWSPLTLEANTYPGLTEPLETIEQPNFLAVRADVDEEVVYQLTKAVFENLFFLQRLHEPFKFLTPERAVAGLPVPIHPGAMRYYEEIRLNLDNAFVAENDYNLFGNDLNTPDELREQLRQRTIELITAEDGTSGLMMDDLVDVMAPNDGIRMLPVRGKGAAHNLADLLYTSGVDVAVLQADALEHELKRGVYPGLIENLRFITKWVDAEVHLLVRNDILDIKDLRDQPVNFGPAGSGGEVTASNLFNHMRLPVRQTSYSHSQALLKLKAGEIAAMVHVAPKPVPLFRDIEVRDGLRFLSLPNMPQSKHYRQAALTMQDYPTMVFGEKVVSTLAVPQMLATYNWPADHERYRPIAHFAETFLTRLVDLQDESRHVKWRDVDPAFELGYWRRHPVVDTYLMQLKTAAGVSGRGGPLNGTAVDSGAAPAGNQSDGLPEVKPSIKNQKENDFRQPVF